MAECIHGFDDGLCDTCFPKAVPERPAVRRPAANPAVRASAPRRDGRGSSSPRSVATPTLLDQRIYHVTHLANLAGILADGLLAPSLARPEVDVSSSLTRELRDTALVTSGGAVSQYVPFLFAPEATPWHELRAGAVEPRWSAAARAAASTDFVFLISTVRAVSAEPAEVAVADGDAAGTATRFATGDGVLGMLSRLHGSPASADAELLVRDRVNVDAVQLIGVASDPVRARVRDLLQSAGHTTKVAVYPPWFIEG